MAYENLNLCIESFKQIRNIYYDKLESAELIPNYSFEVCLKNNFINKLLQNQFVGENISFLPF